MSTSIHNVNGHCRLPYIHAGKLRSRYGFPWAWDWSWKIHVNQLNFYVHAHFYFKVYCIKSYKQAVNGVTWQESKMHQSSYKTVYKPVIL